MLTSLSTELWKKMIYNGAATLEKNAEELNALNVFPVPDGDTGTNMAMTFVGAAREVATLPEDSDSMEDLLEAMKDGALKGARGNSGVILSQILAGFPECCRQTKPEVYTAKCFADALMRGKEMAYGAVMRPKEGTILTVVSDMAKAAQVYCEKYEDVGGLFEYMLKAGQTSLKKTPDLLPVLRQANVVDAGGAGLLALLMGFQSAIEGKDIDMGSLLKAEKSVDFSNLAACDTNIEYGYCTEFFIVNLYPTVRQHDIGQFRNALANIGDCVLVVGDPSLVKVHVHTNTPGTALNMALQLGELSRIKIDNMREQHMELQDGAVAKDTRKPLAVVAVYSGDGFKSIFQDCQIQDVVEGGQSMNPSADDIAKAIRYANADTVIVLPNNKNIILAAEQSARLVDCSVRVLKTRTLPEGIEAAVAYDPEAGLEKNIKEMERAAHDVWTGLVTRAVRDAALKDRSVSKGEIVGISDGSIEASGDTFEGVISDLLAKSPEEAEMITLYYGNDVDEKDAKMALDAARKAKPDCDVDLLAGGQKIYDYILSAV